MAKTWVETTYDGYDEAVSRATFAMDAYTGEARDKAAKQAGAIRDPEVPRDPDQKIPVDFEGYKKMGTYLRRRAQGEHLKNYRERVAITRYPMHFQAIVGEFTGSLSEVYPEAERQWGALGEFDDTSSAAYRLWHDLDGAGRNWVVCMSEALTTFSVVHDLWYLVMPPAENGQLPTLSFFDTERVRNFWPKAGPLREVIVSDTVVLQAGLKEAARAQENEEPTTEEQFIHYTTEGWTRYVVEDDRVIERDSGAWSQPFVTRDGRPRVPLGRVRLDLKFPVGYRTAQGAIDLYNLLSDVRNLIRIANHPSVRGMDMTRDQYQTTITERKAGANTYLGNWDYINPDPSNARVGYDIYREETGDYYITSFQQYNDAPKVKTARQVDEDSRGRTSFQSTLSNSADEFENDLLWLLSQIIAPAEPSTWGEARVERKKSFRVIDPEDLADRRTVRMQQWSDMGWSRRTSLIEGGGYSEEEADRIIAEDRVAIGQDAVEQ